MNNLIIKRSQIVYAQLATTTVGQKYQFADNPMLSQNNILLYGIECFTATQLSTVPTGQTVIPAATVDQIVVTLVDNQKKEFVYQMPIYSMVRSLNGGFVVMVEPRIINLTNCYVQITNNSGLSANEVVPFNFYFDFIK